ncbi:MAG: YebC/PmpR family DNA-binding transcriptional regulator [Patescibacteria group bacterium]
MSGHSKWANIKNRKASVDKKRGKLFSNLSKIITVAAKEKGGDIQMNPRLRTAIETAKAANMPQDNIEKAVKKGTGELEGVTLEEFTCEAYGPGNSAIIIEGITDNKNRTISEIKHLLDQHKGKIANPGNVLWMFEKIGKIITNGVENNEIIELTAIDAGAEDIKKENDKMTILTNPENLYEIKKTLEENPALKNIRIESANMVWQTKSNIKISDEKTKNSLKDLLEALDEHDDVQNIFTNAG